MSTYETDPSSAKVSPNGWARLPSGVWVTKVALVDEDEPGLFAHLDYDSSLEAAKREGVSLISAASVLEVHRHGHHVEPAILPDASQRAAMPRLPGEARDAYERRLRVDMSSLEWCWRHDSAVWADLAADWDLELPVAGCGTQWVGGAPVGRSRLFGWTKVSTEWWRSHDMVTSGDYTSEVLWWQPLMNAHNRGHKDYGTLTFFETYDTPSGTGRAFDVEHDTDPGSIGARAVAKARTKLGLHEATGHNDGEQIAQFFTGATRLINGREVRTGWRSGWDWCAAFYGWCGGPGWRIAVHEYVTDARAAGTWRPQGSGYVPKVGDGMILSRWSTMGPARILSDPTVPGNEGHIARVVEIHEDAIVTIGGNEGNAVRLTSRHRDDITIKGYLEVP